MGQQTLIYSFVARGTVLLAEYTEFKGNFTGIAAQCLEKLPASNNKFTYNCDGHTFNYLVENGFSKILLLLLLLLCFHFAGLICDIFIDHDLHRLPLLIDLFWFDSLNWLTFSGWSVCLTVSFECFDLFLLVICHFCGLGDSWWFTWADRYWNLWIRILWNSLWLDFKLCLACNEDTLRFSLLCILILSVVNRLAVSDLCSLGSFMHCITIV